MTEFRRAGGFRAAQGRWWPWPLLWILAAVGHALGNAPHPQPAPIPQPVPVVTPAPVPIPDPDDPCDRATAWQISTLTISRDGETSR